MSYIPTSAMPHAKPHEHVDEHHENSEAHANDTQANGRAKPKKQKDASPDQGGGWMPALAIGGALAIGAVATAFFISRGEKKPKSDGRKDRKRKGGKKTD